MTSRSPLRDFSLQNGSFFLPFLSPTVTPSHEDSDPYHELLFVPFQPTTKIDFGTCRMRQSLSCKLNIFNPRDESLTALLVDLPDKCPVQVETVRLPISESVPSVSGDSQLYHLPPNSSALLRITWTPTDREDLYLSLTFKWGNRLVSKVVLYGKVEPAVEGKSRRVLFEDVKTSLGVTKSLSSSFRLPLRSVTLNSPFPDKSVVQPHPLITPTPSHTFLETADTSTASLPSTTQSFIASTPMQHHHLTRPLITHNNNNNNHPCTEQSFVHPSAIKRPAPGSSRQDNTRSLSFSLPAASGAAAGAGAGCFDSEWAEKQTRAFTHWLNYVLTPPDSSHFTASSLKGQLASDTSPHTSKKFTLNLTTTFRSSPPPSPTDLAPAAATAAAAEPKYSLTQRKYLSRLREKMLDLFKSRQLTSVLYQLHTEVDQARLRIRPEKPVWKDVGLKEDLLRNLLSYHPLWLRLGLEAVFSCHVPVSHEMDSRMLKKFLNTNLVTSRDICGKYSHRKVPGLFTKGYELAIGKHVTFKYFALILFLDMAKRQRLIDHDPCLFVKGSGVKCSREMLLFFSRNFLQGEGDITKHLHNLGYHVSHKQSFLEEFDYTVTNLATDLRDGIRLSRLLELLTQDWSVSEKLRIPATSLTPRLANNKLFLDKLMGMLHFPVQVTNKDLAIGHREKTLSLIWALIFHFRVDVKIDEMLLRREIAYIRTEHSIRDNNNNIPLSLFDCDEQQQQQQQQQNQFNSNTLQLLLEWCSVIGRVFGFRVTDFSSSFRDGRALCYILHYYHPCLLSRQLISADDAKCNLELFCEKMSSLGGLPAMPPSSDFHQTATGPNEKVVIMYVAYLCAQQLELREEIRAAIVIQRGFKRYLLRCEQTLINQISYDSQLDEFHSQAQAATTIQSYFRRFVARRKFHSLRHRESLLSEMSFQLANWYLSEEITCVLSEVMPQTILARQQRDTALHSAMDKIKCVLSDSRVRLIQSSIREYNSRVETNGESLHTLSTDRVTSAIQSAATATAAESRLERDRLSAAATTIQKCYRGWLATRRAVSVMNEITRVIVVLQRAVRRYLFMKQVSHTRLIDTLAGEIVHKALLLSSSRLYTLHVNAAITIQCWHRMVLARGVRREKELLRLMVNSQLVNSISFNLVSIVLISSTDSIILSRNRAATTIQLHFRRFLTVKRCRGHFLLVQQSVLSLQCAVRMFLTRKHNGQFISTFSTDFVSLALTHSLHSIARDNAALLIQTRFRTHLSVRRFQHLLQSLTAAARTLQLAFRSHSTAVTCRREYLRMKHASHTIQSYFRDYLATKHSHHQFLQLFASQLVTQSIGSAVLHTIEVRKRDLASLTIQTFYRTFICKKQYQQLKQHSAAARTIQLAYRNYLLSTSQREDYLRRKLSALIIQRTFRLHLLRLETSSSALNLLSHELVTHAVSSSLLQLTSVRSHAAVSIQSWYRMVVTRQDYKRLLLERIWCVLVLQQGYRNSRITAMYRSQFVSLKKSAILIQRGFRQLITRSHENRFLLDVFASCVVQDVVVSSRHLFLTERTQAVVCIQKWYRRVVSLDKRQQQRLTETRAALTIQAYFRGHCVRDKIQNTYLLNVKRRLSEATRTAQNEQQLRNKIPKYIDILLNARSLEQKYNILDNLKNAVYVSESCARKVRQEGLDVLYMLVDNNVRSPSIIQRVEKAADVLLQLSKWPSISEDIFLCGQSIPIITDVLHKIHATQPSTVRILSRLLIQFCKYPNQVALIHTYHHTSILKIHKCLTVLKRKYTVGSKRMQLKAKRELARSIHELESVFRHFRFAY